MATIILALAMQVAEVQPIAFSHRLHADRGATCVACHPGSGSGVGVMGAAGCVACHRGKSAKPSRALRQIEEYARSGRAIPWERVYELPKWVKFDHRRHVRTTCAECHGPVERRDALAEEVVISMKFCRDCHLRSKAKVVCGTCHPEK